MASGARDSATAAGSETARIVADLWGELFQIERPGSDDHFLDLGGDSLLGKRLLAGLEARLGCKIPFRTILDAPTLSEFTARVQELCEAR